MNRLDKFILAHSVSRPITETEREKCGSMLYQVCMENNVMPDSCMILYSYQARISTLTIAVVYDSDPKRRKKRNHRTEMLHQFVARCRIAAAGTAHLLTLRKPEKMRVEFALAV